MIRTLKIFFQEVRSVPWELLLVSYFCFAVAGCTIISIAKHSEYHTKKCWGVAIGVVFTTIAVASLVLMCVVILAAKKTGVGRELDSHTETVILENVGSPDEDKYYTVMSGKWVYSYLDSKGDTQIGYADAENCHEHSRNQDEQAFLLITTTDYEVQYNYLCFVAYGDDSIQTYDFYTL